MLKLFDQEEWERVSEVRRKKMRECIKSGDDATNFLIKRLVAEVAPLVMVGTPAEKKRWTSLLVAAKHLADKSSGGGGCEK